MPFNRDRRIFFKRDRGLYPNSRKFVFLGGALLSAALLYFLNPAPGTNERARHEPTIARFAFAPQGFASDRNGSMADDGLLTRVSTEAPLTGSVPEPSTDTGSPAAPDERAGNPDGDLARAVAPAPSTPPADVEATATEQPPTAAATERVEAQRPRAAVAALTVEEPSRTTTEATAAIDVVRSRLRPAPPRSPRIERTRKPRQRARRAPSSAGPPQAEKMAPWARRALFNSGS